MVNRQGVFGLAKSWFYLTLWRGTPPEFTTNLSAKVQALNGMDSDIQTSQLLNAKVTIADMAEASIGNKTEAEASIVMNTGVVWHVG